MKRMTIRSLPQAYEFIKEMNLSPEWDSDYRQTARGGLAAILEDRMKGHIDWHLEEMAILGESDRRNGSFSRHLLLAPAKDKIFAEYEEFGVEDLQICPIEGDYLLTYSAYSRHGVRVSLARTRNFEKIEPIALITQADLRNVVIFPVRFAAKEWLHIYHGVFKTMAGAVYRLGAALHNLNDPAKIMGISDQWILQPEDPWEVSGYVPNVVFTCGAVPEDDGTVKIYWGGADTVMCAGTAHIDDLVQLCLTNPR